MTLEQAKKVLRSVPDGDDTLAAVLTVIRARRAESMERHTLPPKLLSADDRQFESGAFTALDDLGAEFQALQAETKVVKPAPKG